MEKTSQETSMLVMTRTWPGGWQKAADETTALRTLRREWPGQIADYGYAVFEVDPATYMDGMGSFVHPIGRPPKLIKEVEGKKPIKKRA
jgi:hypothetical protein